MISIQKETTAGYENWIVTTFSSGMTYKKSAIMVTTAPVRLIALFKLL